jgi:MFS family permease
MGGDRSGRRRRAFSSLAGNTALLRVLAAYLLFILTEYAVWIAMLVFAYNRGGTAVAGLVAVAQLAPAAVVAPVAASLADRRSPVVMLAGGYLAQVAGMAGTAAAIGAGAPLAAYAAAVFASTAVTTTRPAQSALIPSLGRHPGSADRGQRGRGLAGSRRGRRGRAAGRGADLAGRGGQRVRGVRGAGPGWRRCSWPACGRRRWRRRRTRIRTPARPGSPKACGWRSGSRGCGSCWPC